MTLPMAESTEPFVGTTLLRGLVAGFTLVLLSLGVASFVAVQGTRAIEDDTAQVVREQLVMARLLNDAQAGQNMLTGVLHQLTRDPGAVNEDQLLRDLESADAALDRVAQSASSTPESARWTALHDAEPAFSSRVRMNGGEEPDGAMRSLVLEIGFSCIQFLNVPGVYDYVGSQLGLANSALAGVAFPLHPQGRHPSFHCSKLNTQPADALCLRFDDGLTTATARLEVRWFATPFL